MEAKGRPSKVCKDFENRNLRRTNDNVMSSCCVGDELRVVKVSLDDFDRWIIMIEVRGDVPEQDCDLILGVLLG